MKGERSDDDTGTQAIQVRGGIFALLGSDGAGETTVVRILSTLLKADAGQDRG